MATSALFANGMKLSDSLADDVAAFFEIRPYQDIITWAQENIDFSEDISAERNRLDFSLSPHLIEPLRAWEFQGKRREVTVCGIEQHGKTLLEIVGVLYSMIYNPCSMLCVYPSDDLAESVNKMKYEPLIRKIPALAAQLDKPRTRRADGYFFDTSIMYFQGAGTKIMSRSCKIMVGDEIDQYPVSKTLSPIEDTRKRGRSYTESIYYKTCTPKEENGAIWTEFLKGSQGYWTLRCKGCGKLSMRSCDFANFQFEKTFDEAVKSHYPIPGSARLICPECGHEHTEADKYQLNQQGAYVHKFPERLDERPTFQFGALCSQFPHMSWDVLAAKICECGKRADIKAHYELDNSYRGLPYRARNLAKEDMEDLKPHLYLNAPKADDVEMVFLISDTQDTFSPTGVFALDRMDNLWLLEYENVTYLSLAQDEREALERRTGEKIRTVEDMLESHYFGIKPLFHVVDYRGHRQGEIKRYAYSRRNVRMYAGGREDRLKPWKLSHNDPRMIIVDAKYYQKVLLWQLHNQRNTEQNYLWLPELPHATQMEITCVQPGLGKNGHLYENWEPQGEAVHDAFDVLKMAYFAVDFAINALPRSNFRFCDSPALRRRFGGAQKETAAALHPAALARSWIHDI